MEPEGPGSDDGRESGPSRRACDQCRLRKIRCDKRTPCSNCRTSKTVCRSTGAGQKPNEPRRRVLISDQYEKKIDLIEERLGGIEQVLRDLKSVMGNTATEATHITPPTEQMTPSMAGCPSSTAALDQGESSPAFEGNSSLAAHSAYASKFLETAVSQSALQMTSPKIEAALSTLKQIVNMQDQQPASRGLRFRHQKAVPRSGLRDLRMPPMQVVVELLRNIKENPPSVFQSYFPFISAAYFVQKCREVYFATEEYSDATFIIVNGGLFHIFLDYSYTIKSDETRSEYQTYLQLCQNNMETGLANLNLLMPATEESIEALTLGAVYAIEISKPSFAWTLVSTAAQLCQTLGYHRASTMETDSSSGQENQFRLFWSVYCLDKGLSLRLGRASSIQDYDISLSPSMGRVDIPDLWRTVYTLWITLSRIQGKVYELLFSPAALTQPETERVAHARRLAAEMQDSVMEPFKRLNMEFHRLSDIEILYLKSDEVSRLSVLTLIYRAIPSPPAENRSTFIPDCVQTARAALESHQDCMITLKESNEALKCSYMHWSILYAPFVPFIVIFCHIIESTDRTDLSRLEDFVSSLHPICPLSEAIDKLYRLCHVLGTIARLYVEAKTQAQYQEDRHLASVGEEFDAYLSALGLAPGLSMAAPAAAVEGGAGGAGPGVPEAAATGFAGQGPGPAVFGDGSGLVSQDSSAAMNQTMQLGNWFSGNQYMMGLLEEDLEIFKGL